MDWIWNGTCRYVPYIIIIIVIIIIIIIIIMVDNGLTPSSDQSMDWNGNGTGRTGPPPRYVPYIIIVVDN